MKKRCNGCHPAIQERSRELRGGWSLKQYEGVEGFFGWLALQTVKHRMKLGDLSASEARALGSHLRDLEKGIYSYWRRRGHAVDRIYVMYFLESLLTDSPEWHLHISLVPRFRALRRLLIRRYVGVDAYQIAKLRSKLPHFLDRRAYRKEHGEDALREEGLRIVDGVLRSAPRRIGRRDA